jgi:DNA invertase Pin-like site-specific DNA recombinase
MAADTQGMTKITRRAVGIVRNSPDEKNDDKHSPEIQAASMRAECERQGWELLEPLLYEIDVSANWELDRRTGLSAAVAMVESGEADVIIVARFDRMVRNTRVQAEITKRVEDKGGDLYAIDFGAITNGDATRKLSAGFLGLVAEYHSNTTRERTIEGVQAAIDLGIPPFKGATAGYTRPIIGVRKNGKPIYGPLVPDQKTKDAVAEAWAMRADGATVQECQRFLAQRGVEYSYPGVIKLFKSRLPLGELHHSGKKHAFRPNLHAHPPIIDRDVWERVQKMRSPKGRQAKSERLLSRLGVLRCGGCGGRMSVGDDWRGGKVYRCSTSVGACPERSTIMADTADAVVWDAAVIAAEERKGHASSDAEVNAATAEADRAEEALKGLVAMLTGFENVEGVREQMAEAQAEATRLRAKATRLASTAGVIDIDPTDPRITLQERRGVVAWTIRRALVARSAPGLQGAARIAVEPFSEDAPGDGVEVTL